MPWRRPLLPISVVVVAGFAVLLVGCGGGGGGSSTTGATTTARTGALAFARCMRAHGFSGWPDPTRNGGFDKATLVQLGYGVTRVRAVEQRFCGHLLGPNGLAGETAQQQRTRLADALSFARCMRSHGVRQFPDPDPHGDLSVQRVQARGIDVHSPAVLQTVQTCLPASHGALTAAKVRQALREAGG